MSQRNQKLGERKSDLVCSYCEQELKWEGSILDGGMVCKNLLCGGEIKKSVNYIADIEADELIAITFDKVLERYYTELQRGHRAWCRTVINGTYNCTCGYSGNCNYSEVEIRNLETHYYGAV